MPMVIGTWRPTIVLPDAAPATWQQPQWEAVLLHEAAHIARRDHWAVPAQRIAVILFWWCPLAHVLARRLNALRENICDDCALQGTCDRIAYAELLVESAEHFLRLTAVPAPLGLLDSARGGLTARVTRLLEKERPTMTRLSLPGKLLGAAFLMTACLLTAAGTAFSGGQPQPQKKIQIKIIVDGKEIDLGDPKLWEHIEAAQKKIAGDTQPKPMKVLVGVKPEQPDEARVVEKKMAFSPDGKFLVTEDGKHIIVFDAASGKIAGKFSGHVEPTKPEGQFQFGILAKQPQAKPDPRIEELVKQAEAIKPGSGAEIRRALEATPKAGGGAHFTDPALKLPPMMPNVRFTDEGGKKVIIITIDDAKAHPLHEADLHKLIEKGLRFEFQPDLPKKKADDNPEKAHNIELFYKAIGKKAADKNVPPTPVPADLEALSRQLERLNAELNELRKRLDAGKK
jgi:hypothetical protein